MLNEKRPNGAGGFCGKIGFEFRLVVTDDRFPYNDKVFSLIATDQGLLIHSVVGKFTMKYHVIHVRDLSILESSHGD